LSIFRPPTKFFFRFFRFSGFFFMFTRYCCSNITYLAKSDCETYTISSERMVHEFSPYKEVMKLIDFALVRPAKEYGPRIDIDGPDKDERLKRLENYKKDMESADLKRKKAMRRVSRRFRASTRTQREMRRLQGQETKRLSLTSFGGFEESEDDEDGESKNKEGSGQNNAATRLRGLSRVVTLLQRQVKESEDRILQMLESKIDNSSSAGSRHDEISEDVTVLSADVGFE